MQQHRGGPRPPQMPVNENGESASCRSIMVSPGATASKFSTCNTLHANRRAATEQGGRAHLEDVEAAAGQQKDFFLYRNSAREQQTVR